MSSLLFAFSLLFVAACSSDDVNCPDGQTLCGDRCVDLQNDPRSCGSCGESCGPDELCVMGACSTSCPSDLTDCSGACRDTDTDRDNCGACGTVCGGGEICVDGACAINCPDGQTDCSGQCVDTDTDRNNCGACGTVCDSDERCTEGDCALFCPSGLTDCSGTCRDTDADRANCGGCGVACGTDEQCIDGTCTLQCEGGAPDECAGACTNVNNDPQNCGGCGVVCGVDDVCDNGACESQCGPGTVQCGQTCTSTLTDPLNCGGCGTVCDAAAGASAVCAAGICNLACDAGFDDCDDDLYQSPSNGCEVDTTADAGNCGACGQTCTVPNAAAACVASVCTLGACDIGFEDCNMMAGDGCEVDITADATNCGGCGVACLPTEVCQDSLCQTSGEDCGSLIPLSVGQQTYLWAATRSDYLLTAPSCLPTFTSLSGPDVVFSFTATISGRVQVDLAKPTSERYVFIVSDDACGLAAPANEIACVSEFSGTTMGTGFAANPGQTYYLYFNDSASGSSSLPNPLDITVSLTDCAPRPAASVVSLSPTSGSTTATLFPTFEITFDAAINTTTGTVTITGDQGTSLAYDLSASPSEVSFNSAATMMTIDPGIQFPAGERLTIGWSDLVDDFCGKPVAPPTPAYEVSVIVPPCIPGQGGMIGSTITRIPTTISVSTEYYVAADSNTSTTTGYVYVGGTTALERVPKGGGTVEDVETLAGLTSTNLGYEMLIDGNDIYTIDSATSGTSGRVYRISSDGGASWNVFDAVTFPTAPAEDFRAAAIWRDRIYLITHEGSSTTPTEVWSFARGVATSTTARLELTFSGEGNCSGLSVDDTYVYAVCGDGERGIRVNRATSTVELLTTAFDASSTNNSMYGVDQNGDGAMDFLYIHTWYEEGYFACDPSGAMPFLGVHFTFGSSNSNYGMGFDGASRLYMFDDDTDELIVIE